MNLFSLRRGLMIGMFGAIMISGCGSTNRAAPVTDRTPAPVVSTPVESRTVEARRTEPNPKPVAKQASTSGTASAVIETRNDAQKPAVVTEPTKSKTQVEPTKSNTQAAAPTQSVVRDAGQPYREGDWRPEYYTVRKGDTLYSIALDFGQDYRDIAAWNSLADAGYIQIGQRLRVFAPNGMSDGSTPEPLALPPATLPKSEDVRQASKDVPTFADPMAYRSVYSQQAYADLERRLTGEVETAVVATTAAPREATPVQQKPVVTPALPSATKSAGAGSAATPDDRLRWEWPAPGQLLYRFSEGPIKKGVAIEGQPGQSVVSSAPGKVVYSGSGLRGYGNLIIVKHNATYLSVYAHNQQLLVSEGQMVAQGQKIAVMGEISTGQTALHFEIRRLGKPVNPLEFLPDRAS